MGCTSSWNKSSLVISKKYYQASWCYLVRRSTNTVWKVFLLGAFLFRISLHSDWIRTSKISNTDTFHAVLVPDLLWLHAILIFNASQTSNFCELFHFQRANIKHRPGAIRCWTSTIKRLDEYNGLVQC